MSHHSFPESLPISSSRIGINAVSSLIMDASTERPLSVMTSRLNHLHQHTHPVTAAASSFSSSLFTSSASSFSSLSSSPSSLSSSSVPFPLSSSASSAASLSAALWINEKASPSELESSTSLVSFNKLVSDSLFPDSLDENTQNAILIIIYTVIIIVSLSGNLVVLKIMLSRNTPRTATNVLIINLAFSDLLLTCFNIPVNVVRFVVRDWPFGQSVCSMTPFLQSLSAHCSAITMMVIALERYNRIIGGTIWQSIKKKIFCICCCGCRQLRFLDKRLQYVENEKIESCHRISKHRLSATLQSNGQSLHLILLIWSSAAMLAMPSGFGNKVNTMQGFADIGIPNMTRCTNQQNRTFRLILAITIPISQYLLPIGITTIVYLRIGHFLWMRRDPIGSCTVNRREILLKRRRNRIKMLAIVVTVFAICWLPLHIYVTLVEFYVIPQNMTIYFITHWVAMSSVCYNPFIYCWLNENFRSKTNTILSFAAFVGSCLTSCCRFENRNFNSKDHKHSNKTNNKNGSFANKSNLLTTTDNNGEILNSGITCNNNSLPSSPELSSKFETKVDFDEQTSPRAEIPFTPTVDYHRETHSSKQDSPKSPHAPAINDCIVILSEMDSVSSNRQSPVGVCCNTTTIAVPNTVHLTNSNGTVSSLDGTVNGVGVTTTHVNGRVQSILQRSSSGDSDTKQTQFTF